MVDIHTSVERWEKLHSDQEKEKQTIQKTIEIYILYTIDLKYIDVREGVVYITVSSVLRSRIYTHKQSIIETLASKQYIYTDIV